MNLQLILHRDHAKAWLNRLLADLRQFGFSVTVRLHENNRPSPPIPAWLIGLEQRLYKVDGKGWTQPFIPDSAVQRDEPDQLAIAFSADLSGSADLTLAVEADDFVSLPQQLGQGTWPRLILRHRDGREWMARPASERPFSVAATLDAYCQRLALLIMKAAHGHPDTRLPPLTQPIPRAIAAVAFANFRQKMLGLLATRHFRADHWNVGLRPRMGNHDVPDPTLPGQVRWLGDDGASYLADPILWEVDGRAWLFVEVFPFDTQKGYLAVAELDDAGTPLSGFRPVLTRDGHLSYPFLFRHAGETYLLPENAAEGHLPLYRARSFPDEWEPCPPLLTVPLQDATLFAHEGRYWLLGNEDRGGSSWDCLCAYHAPSPLGPFEPHPANPLVIDAATARSAGPVLDTSSGLIRPVQDCIGGYGRALGFVRIDALSPTTYQQAPLPDRLTPPAGRGVVGLHTYCRSERFEAIDGLTTYTGRLAG